MASSANINDFISSFAVDLARPSNFEVEIIPPTIMLENLKQIDDPTKPAWLKTIGNGDMIQKISKLRCEKAEIPPRAFVLIEQKTYGPVEYYPVQNFYNKIPLTFICSGNMAEKYFFDYWMEIISSSYPSSQYNSGPVRFDFQYKNNYASNIKIKQFGVDVKDVKYSLVLVDAFPAEVYSLPLSWAQKDDYHRLDVIFAYRYFYVE